MFIYLFEITNVDLVANHIKTLHKDHKDYKCKSCGKTFSEAGTLRSHMHTVHESHKCESCRSHL